MFFLANHLTGTEETKPNEVFKQKYTNSKCHANHYCVDWVSIWPTKLVAMAISVEGSKY